MIPLAGKYRVEQALDELQIYIEEGVDGAIIENYHGTIDDVIATLESIKLQEVLPSLFVLGVNILPNDFSKAFRLADDYDLDFLQLDYVAGQYQNTSPFPVCSYEVLRSLYDTISVLRGVHPKYYTPRSSLETDIVDAKHRADAIVVTGQGTGMPTPVEKIRHFKTLLREYPLVIGAGLCAANIQEQLSFADGGIIGSAFKKDDDTMQCVERARVKKIMDIVRRYREE